PAQRRDTARLYLSDDGHDVRGEAIRIGLAGRHAERLSCRTHRYVPAAVPSLRLILITVCACHRDPGRSVSTLRRFSSAAWRLRSSRRGHLILLLMLFFAVVDPGAAFVVRFRILLTASADHGAPLALCTPRALSARATP